MLLKLVIRLSACLLLATSSGCYWFCPWPSFGCGAPPMGYNPAFASPAYSGGYGQCVAPPLYTDCNPVPCSMNTHAVNRVRAQRLERIRRRDMMAHTPRYRSPRASYQRPPRVPRERMPRVPRAPRMRGGYPMPEIYGDHGYGGYGYGYAYDDFGMDGYAYDPYFQDYALMGYEEEFVDGYGSNEFALMGHNSVHHGEMIHGGWMPASGCSSCGDTDGAMVMSDGGWTTSSDCPSCQSSTSMTPVAPQPAQMGAPLQPVPHGDTPAPAAVPMSGSSDDYYMPRAMPAPIDSTRSNTEQSSGGSPVQPVLWVPQGL